MPTLIFFHYLFCKLLVISEIFCYTKNFNILLQKIPAEEVLAISTVKEGISEYLK